MQAQAHGQQSSTVWKREVIIPAVLGQTEARCSVLKAMPEASRSKEEERANALQCDAPSLGNAASQGSKTQSGMLLMSVFFWEGFGWDDGVSRSRLGSLVCPGGEQGFDVTGSGDSATKGFLNSDSRTCFSVSVQEHVMSLKFLLFFRPSVH